MKKFNALFNQFIFLVVLFSMAAGYFVPLAPTPLLKNLVIVMFTYMTFSTSLGTSFQEFLRTARNPKMPLYILSVVHVAIPVVAWLVGLIFFPDDPLIRLGYLIGAAVPVGVTSLVWTYIARGNIPVSLVTVSIDTILAPLLLPLFILVTVGVSIRIDYFTMIFDLLFMITVPSIVGMLLHDFTRGKTKSFADGAGGVLSRLSVMGIVFLNSAFVSTSIELSPLILKILCVTSLIVAIGYFIGYVAGKAIHADRETTVSIIYCTGMRNVVIGLVIATSYFSHETALPIVLAMLFQQPFAALTAKILNARGPVKEDMLNI
jgi:predicted Na+-dependent transporter